MGLFLLQLLHFQNSGSMDYVGALLSIFSQEVSGSIASTGIGIVETIWRLQLMKHFDLSSEDLKDVNENYAHVLGMNKMANLLDVMRALNWPEWFFNKFKDGNQKP
ncbi:hypothetical protein L6164_003571 [Bauhinia variegata]|uniref:Uncharacterized protein n=1 Tax=Bauhinia variegata TaxID=167791 RepID=A0ACB9Q751_BAUVA|nr:hypothetical protein L6164_003571 [Bauhinia variegata]